MLAVSYSGADCAPTLPPELPTDAVLALLGGLLLALLVPLLTATL